MKDLNIPVFRAKKIDRDEWIEGYLDVQKSITFKELKLNLKENVFRINYNNIIAGKEMIESICILTNSRVVLWDYVNMTAKLEENSISTTEG